MLKKIISIIILSFIFFLLLSLFFGSNGWFTKTIGLFFTVFGDASETLEGSSPVIVKVTPSGFHPFFQSLDHAIYSPDDHCRVAFTVPDDFENHKITFEKTNNGMLVLLTTKDGEEIGGSGYITDRRIYTGVEPCVIYGRAVVQSLCENLQLKQNQKSGPYHWKQPEYFATDVVLDDKKLIFNDQEGNVRRVAFQRFYLYRVDDAHTCFLPNDERGIDFFGWFDKDDCLEDNLVDPDGIGQFEAQFPVCREGTLQRAINKNGFAGMVHLLKTSPAFYIDQFQMSSFDLILSLEDFEGISMPALMLATIYVESNGYINAVSPTGVQGLTQIAAKTANNLRVCFQDWCDVVCRDNCRTYNRRTVPLYAILGGYEVYKQKYRELAPYFQHLSLEERMKFIIAAYNSGSGPLINAIQRLQAAKIPISWDAVAQELKPEDITGSYFNTYQKKANKIKEIRNHVPKVLAALEEAKNYVAEARSKENLAGDVS